MKPLIALVTACSHSHGRSSQRHVIAGLLLAYAGHQSVAYGSGTATCDPIIMALAAPRSDLAYRLRGDHCEGFYRLPLTGSPNVAVSPIRAIGFEPQPPPIGPRTTLFADGLVTLRLPAVHAGGVHLRAYPCTTGVYYQMDAYLERGDSVFSWRSEILKSLPELGAYLGLIGTLRGALRDSLEGLLLPIFGLRPGSDGTGRYVLRLVSDYELDEVLVTIAPARDPRRTREVLRSALVGAGQVCNVSLTADHRTDLWPYQVRAQSRLGEVRRTGLLYMPKRQ